MLLSTAENEINDITLLYTCVKREDKYDSIIFFLCNTWNKQNHRCTCHLECCTLQGLLIFAIERFG